MTTPAYPLFVSVAGSPLNFRLVCSKSSMKTEYLNKIKTHGGASQKSEGKRIILVGGSLPCEQGHFRCDAHRQFSKEPAFRISWIDDCLEERELLDIKAYLLNSSPAFARIDFMKDLYVGTYNPPVPSVIPESFLDDYVKVEVNLPCGGDPNQVLESDAIIMAACQQALTLSTTVRALCAEDNSSSQVPRKRRSPVAASKKSQNQNPTQIAREPHDPLRVLGNSQASSTPLRPLVESTRQRSFITEGGTSTSDDKSVLGSDNILSNDIEEPKRFPDQRKGNSPLPDPHTSRIAVAPNANPGTSRSQTATRNRPFALAKVHDENSPLPDPHTSRIAVAQNAKPGTSGSQTATRNRPLALAKPHDENSPLPDPHTSRIVVAQNAKPGTSRSQTATRNRPFSAKPLDNGSRIPTTFTSSSGSDSEASPAAKRAVAARKVVETQQDSSDSDQEFGPPPGAVVRLKSVRQNTREPYTRNEEVAILNYIKASKKFTGIKSNVIWKEMDGKPGVHKRSWHSLKNHFLKFMLPNLEKYKMFTEEQLKKLRSTESQIKGKGKGSQS